MIEVNVKDATAKIRSELRGLSSTEINKATARAINHTLGKAKTEVNRSIRDVYRIPATDINNGLFIRRAFPNKLYGFVMASNFPINMSVFNPTEVRSGVATRRIGGRKTGAFASKRTRSKTEGVLVEIIKGQKKLITSAYLAISDSTRGTVRASGHYTQGRFIFADTEAKRRLKSVSVGAAATNDTIQDRILKRVVPDYTERLKYEIEKGLKF